MLIPNALFFPNYIWPVLLRSIASLRNLRSKFALYSLSISRVQIFSNWEDHDCLASKLWGRALDTRASIYRRWSGNISWSLHPSSCNSWCGTRSPSAGSLPCLFKLQLAFKFPWWRQRGLLLFSSALRDLISSIHCQCSILNT